MSNSTSPFDTPEARTWLSDALHRGPVEVVFTKSDGTERKMQCTLQEGVVVPHEKKTERVKEKHDDVFAVWDLEKSAWRSFKLSTVISVSFDPNGAA